MKPQPIFCEACKDTGWAMVTLTGWLGLKAIIPCPHCDTGATKGEK